MKERVRINNCKLVVNISFKELVGKKPPEEIKDIDKFRLLKILNPEKEKSKNIIKVKIK